MKATLTRFLHYFSGLRLAPALALAGIFSLQQVTLAAEIEGQSIPDTYMLGDDTLVLTGCGKREMLWNSLYLVAIYLEEATSDVDKIMSDSSAKAIRLKVLYGNELPEELPELWREPLQEEMNREMLKTVLNLYDEISTGDIVIFSYHPQLGTRVSLNDEDVIERNNSLLVTTLLENWIGDEPVSQNLKRLLLSQSCQ